MSKTLTALAQEIERLEKFKNIALDNIKSDVKVTINIVGTDPIELDFFQHIFFQDLINLLEIQKVVLCIKNWKCHHFIFNLT